MTFATYLQELNNRFPTFDDLKNHIETVLTTRSQRNADFSRLPDDHPLAGVLISLVVPKEVVESTISPIPHIHIIYEKRSDKMKNHPGQMAFPGGTIEEVDDGSVINAAFREAEEEVGINPNNLEYIANLDEFIASSHILVNPVVAWLIEDYPIDDFAQNVTTKYAPRTQESVATVVMPLTHLLNPKHYRSNEYMRKGKAVGFVRFFNTTEIRPGDNIWGLTASMTRRLIDELFEDNLLPEEILPDY